MSSENIPPLYRPQDDDMSDILTLVEIGLERVNLTWQSGRVMRYIYRLHKARNYTPSNDVEARYLLSHEQLEALHKKLVQSPRKHFPANEPTIIPEPASHP